MNVKANPLGEKDIFSLLASFAGPSIVAMLVSNIYNLVDQIFIGRGIGYLGNAATTVAFPLTTIALAIGLLVGVGSATGFSLELGKGKADNSAKIAACGLLLACICGFAYLVLGQTFLNVLLAAFGGSQENLPYAQEYSRIILWGFPFLIFSNCASNLIRADGSPRYSMMCMVSGAVINCILDPVFIFQFGWGMAGAAWATILGQIVSAVLAALYIPRFQHVELYMTSYVMDKATVLKICKLGMSSSLNQVAILIVQIALNNSLDSYIRFPKHIRNEHSHRGSRYLHEAQRPVHRGGRRALPGQPAYNRL